MERGSTTLLFIYAVIGVSFLSIFYLSAPADTVQLLFLPLLALIVLLGSVLVVIQMVSKHQKLRRKLRKISSVIAIEPAAALKTLYLDIYQLYLYLSHRHQQKYYPLIMGIRQKLEEGVHAEKKVETLLHDIEQKSLSVAQQAYEEIYAYFRKLPQKSQSKYYPKIIHLRQQLERGK